MNNPFDIKANDKSREIAASDFSDNQAQINNALMDLHTSLPAIVISFDPEARTVTAQPAIQRVFNNGDGLSGPVNLPPCVDVPVIFPSGGGYEITFPVSEGDECLLVFAERCIDNWYETGEPSVPADYRQHDLSDAFAIVGISSKPKAVAVNMDGMQIGSGDNRVIISEDSVSLAIGEARLTLTEDQLTSNVNIRCPNLITDKFDTNEHVHSGVEAGVGETLQGQ